MTFKKNGEIAIAKVLCGCGSEIQGYTSKCPACGKTILGIDPVPVEAKEEAKEENKNEEVKEDKDKEEDKS